MSRAGQGGRSRAGGARRERGRGGPGLRKKFSYFLLHIKLQGSENPNFFTEIDFEVFSRSYDFLKKLYIFDKLPFPLLICL